MECDGGNEVLRLNSGVFEIFHIRPRIEGFYNKFIGYWLWAHVWVLGQRAKMGPRSRMIYMVTTT